MAQTKADPPHPPIVSREHWLGDRKRLLHEEKALTHERDRVNAQRRSLPMVKVEAEYVFESPQGSRSLLDLFEGRRQLVVYHFMFDPDWDKGCPGCTRYVDALGDLKLMNERDATFVAVSRAALTKLETYKAERGWDITWVSSLGSRFNYDFHATADPEVAPPQYNYRSKAEVKEQTGHELKGEQHGISVFFRVGDDVFHTYSSFARGVESVSDSYSLLDLTPYGRQEDFEESPAGWPQRPTYG